MAVINAIVNNRPVVLQADPATPLLDVLRDELGLTGTKQGCDHEGECGACTVLLDGRPVRACLTPVGKVAGREVLTVEGLGAPDHLHPLQTAFIEVGAVQCGYCTPGMLMAAKGLLDRELNPTREQIVEALEGNLCRCTGYKRILRAVELAAARMRGEELTTPRPAGDRPIGGDLRRVDAVDKVTGRTRYVEDIVMPGMLFARTVRCPHPHARLLSLDVAPALHLPGVVRVLTAQDVPGENGVPEYSSGEPVLTPVGETLKMLGAPIALVVATSPSAAQAGVDAVQARYERLPPVLSPEEALLEGAVPIYADGNVLSNFEVAHGDLEAAWAESDVVVETRYHTCRQEHGALEREAALGYIDDEGRVTVVSGNHEPHWQRDYIAHVLGLPSGRVRVITPPTGGSFGNRQDAWPLLAGGLLAYHLHKPVRLAFARQESFTASPKRHPYHMNFRIGATCAGRLTGIQVDITADTGGYDSLGTHIPNYAVTFSGGAYLWQAVQAQARSVFTNNARCGAFRGFGAPQPTFGLECSLDELIQQLGHDPLVFRRENALPQSAVSFLGYPVAEALGYVQVLDALDPHYRALQDEVARFNHQADGSLRMGLGLAGSWHRFGKPGPLCVETHAELAQDGSFTFYFSAPDYGQGTSTLMAQVAAEILGVSRGRVRSVNADTGRTPDSGIIGASRAAYWVGSAVTQAALNLKREIVAMAAEMLDRHPDTLSLTDEAVVGLDGSIRLADVAQVFDRVGKSRKVRGVFDLSPLFPDENRPEFSPFFTTGAQVAQIIVNMQTGVVTVSCVVAAHDVGRAINPVDVQGQIEGSVLMGVGTALMEEYIPGASTGFGDYYLPTIKSAPEIEVELVEVPSLHGAFGVKGVGEAVMFPTVPAIINAISRAIGVRIRELPATPQRVLEALGRA